MPIDVSVTRSSVSVSVTGLSVNVSLTGSSISDSATGSSVNVSGTESSVNVSVSRSSVSDSVTGSSVIGVSTVGVPPSLDRSVVMSAMLMSTISYFVITLSMLREKKLAPPPTAIRFVVCFIRLRGGASVEIITL